MLPFGWACAAPDAGSPGLRRVVAGRATRGRDHTVGFVLKGFGGCWWLGVLIVPCTYCHGCYVRQQHTVCNTCRYRAIGPLVLLDWCHARAVHGMLCTAVHAEARLSLRRTDVDVVQGGRGAPGLATFCEAACELHQIVASTIYGGQAGCAVMFEDLGLCE